MLERYFPDDPPQFLKTPFSCADIDPIKEALIGAGFADISVSVLPRVKTLDDPKAFATGLNCGNPLVDQIRARGDVSPESIVEELARRLAQEFGAGPTRLPMQAIVFEAEAPSCDAM